MPSRIRYDHSFMWEPAARKGLPQSERAQAAADAVRARKAVLASQPPFFEIPMLKRELLLTKTLAKATAKRFATLIVVGIGGSDLGARALISALAVPGKGMRVLFLGANTDPDEIVAVTHGVDWRKTAINVISKSGDTVEPMATFLVLRDMLRKKVGAKKAATHVIATTDAVHGTLRTMAEAEGYATLPVPERIGGRFSALTPVGLFPAACAGVDIVALVAGANDEIAAFASGAADGPADLAALLCAEGERGRTIDVLMPYRSSLREFGAWYRQLWAESLGKQGRGLTPVAALGATDQHSQVQLYNDGPADKVVTFIDVARATRDLRVPKPEVKELAYLGGKSLQYVLRAEREATARALAESGHPSGTLFVDKADAKTLGALMAWFMLATACAAELLEVNAYDQPGVEQGKAIMRSLLVEKRKTG